MIQIDIDDQTFKRLSSIRDDIMQNKKKDMTFEDILNELIDTYQDTHWGHLGASAGGG